MNIGHIEAGDALVCCQCNHERIVDGSWIEGVCAKSFPGRVPARLHDSDLWRFRCSHCRSKKLVKRSGPLAVISRATVRQERAAGRELAVAVVERASTAERAVLLRWAQELIAIRDGRLSSLEKAKRAISCTVESKAIWPFLSFIGGEIKRVGWDERGLPARLALSAAAIGALMLSSKAAGIAALGSAIGVPLWVVFGAGGAFAGVIIEEAQRHLRDAP